VVQISRRIRAKTRELTDRRERVRAETGKDKKALNYTKLEVYIL
jgi:hypothetical protein